ncbi:MAG: DUF2306 domain-containing protein [Sphingomonas sp.]|nr:DUF2306 domain-containing protein [Sphingomonas sp.]
MAAPVKPGQTGGGPLAADRFERVLAVLSAILFALVLAAIVRGQPRWGEMLGVIWFHLATVSIALALTPVMLLRRRGDARHRLLGRIWVVAMLATAIGSFGIRQGNHGGLSVIHILSAWVLIQAPLIWWSARTHRIAMHRSAVRGMVTGAMLLAGYFTFPFNRLLGQWLLG